MKIKVIPYNTLEYASLGAFPATGESGKHYLALDTMLLYTWSDLASEYSSADFRYEGKPAYHGSYLKSGYLEFTMVASPTLIDWHIGDYIRYDRTGRIYRLYSIPQVERQAGTNHTGESFAYRNVQLYDKTKDLSLVPFRDLVPGVGGVGYYFSSKQDVAFTGTVANVVERLNANLEAFFGEGVWNVRIAENIPESYEVTVAKDFSVSGMCIDVLNAIYETWHELGWAYVIENGVDTIIIGYPNIAPATSGNRTNVFSYDNGLTALKRNNGGLDNFCTRLHVYGTERNLINRYYNGKDIYNAESVFIPNLMIPVELWGQTENKPDASKAYIEDADKIALYGLITKDIYFDGTDGRPEVYPSVEQQTIEILKAAKTSLGKTGAGAPDYYPQEEDDSIRVDQIKAAVQMPQDDGTPTNSGEKYIDSFDATINSTIVNAQSVSNRQIREVQLFEYTFVDNGVVDIRWNGALKCVLDQALADGDYISLSLCVYSGTLSRNTLVSSADFKVESNLVNGQILSLDNILSIGSKTNLVTGHYVVTLKYAVSLSNGGGRTITITKEGEVLASANIREALVSNFKIKTHQIGFDIAKMQSSGGATLSLKSGMCAGRDFSIIKAVYNSDDDDWTLTCQRSQDTSTQTYYPNASFPIATDDEFVILGITMPEEYVLAQAHRLYALGQELFDKVSVFQPTFEPSVDSKKVLENITQHPSDPQYKLIEGKYMRLYDEELIGGNHNADVLISEITINEGEAEIATYHVVLSDRASVTGGLPRTVAKLSTEIEKVQQSQRVLAARRETTAQPGTPTFFNEGNNVNPVYFKDGMPRIIDGLDVPENIHTQKNVEAGYGVAAYGMASLAINGGGGQGTVTAINFEGSPEQIYTPSDGLITLPDYPTAASLISDGLASQNYVASYFASNFTQLNIKNTLGISDWALASAKPSYNFSEIGSKPTTLAGYGITDAHIANGVVTLGGNTITPATLTNGKIPLSQIPDAILGQLIYGGTVNGSGVVTLSQNAKDKWGITSLTLTSTNYSTYEGAFFIASADATSGVPSTLGLLVGDWVVATASGWGKIDNTDAVTGIKGDAETNYRIGNVNITKANIGLGNVENTKLSTWAGTANITTLGTIGTGVWHGTAIVDDYIASAATWNAKQNALAFDGTYDASTNKVATKSTVTNAINALDVSNISGFGAGKTLASLTETDGKIAATFQNISITKSQVSDFPTTWALANVTGADDLKAIEALTGTSGFLKKTAADRWALDTDVASGTALSGVSTRVGTLEGYFTSGVANNAAQLGGQFPSYYAVAADYTKTSDFQSFSIKVGTTTLGTYSPTSALILSLVAGSNIAFDTDATNHKLTIRNTYSYTLPMASSDSRGGIRVGNTLNIDSNGILNANIYDGLDQGYTTYALSAKQGKALNTALGTLKTGLTSKGAHNLPIYLNSNAQAVAIDALSVSGNVESTAGGVSASGIASLALNGGGGQGTLTQIQVNGVALADTSGVVNITATTGNAAGKIAIAGQQIPVYGLGSFAYLSSLAFTDLSSHPTTLGGYGITDAKIANGVITLGGNTITPLTGINASMINTALGFTLSGTSGQTYNLATISSNASNGNTAYGWGNHADAGYFAASSFTKANIKSTLGISDWALAASKPSYTHNEIGAGNLTIGNGANVIFLRTNTSWASAIYHHTNADEAVVFLNRGLNVGGTANYTTSWIFAYGTPTDRPAWTTLTPAMQIKGQSVVINKLLGSQVGASYNLDVNGTLNATTIYQNGTALATVATSGSYNDLSDKPNIPTVNNGNLYLQASGTTKTTFTANQSGNSTFNIATGSANGTLSIGGTDVAVKGLGASAYVGYDTTVTKDSAKLITSGAVWTAIDNLPEPMVFKGSLGAGGTIPDLPVNGTASIGDTYKVITAGTYASKAAKVGDTFICLTKTSSANTWELIPSGDEPSGTVTSVGLSMPTGFSVSSSPVTTSGTLTVAFASGYSLPTTAKQGNWDDAYDKRHTHSSLTLSTTAQAYDGTHTLALPASDPYTSARTPSSHASSGTGYGVGTTSNYGHVKLATGDMNGASGEDGVACGKNHTHSQYLPLAGGTMTGAIKRYYGSASDDPVIALSSYNIDTWLWQINHSASASTGISYGFGLKYLGTGAGNDNALALYADNIGGTQVEAFEVKQNGTIRLAVTPNVNGTNVSLVGHTHNYAGSSSEGGAATSANKLNTNAGSATNPVYFSNGVPVACTYSLNKTVPADAVFTDTNTHRPIQLNGTEILGNNTTALNLKAGTNVSLSNSNGTVTIAATDTTYSANNGVGLSGTTFYNSGVRAATINGNYLRINTNGTNADLTIPYATNAGGVAWGNVSDKPTTLSGYGITDALNKLTYEYNTQISFGSTGKLLIGKFPCYDSNVTIYLDSTTHTTYHATIILATQNINLSHGGSITFNVYGDETNSVAPNLYLYYPSDSRYIEIYFSPQAWSKNIVHIKCTALSAAPTNICESVSEIPSTATTKPTNVLNASASVNYATSAGKLTTARTIWGQSFDGTDNIDGAFRAKKDLGGNLSDWIQKQHSGVFEVGRATNAMCVAIGVTDDDWGYIQSKGNGITSTGNIAINPAYNRGIFILGSGNVGIGTSSPSQTLHVAGTIYSSATQGTAPFKVDSTTAVTNLNADLLDGQHGSYYAVKAASKGSTTKPIYTDANGAFQECSTYAGGTAVTLNGTSAATSTASFYAPTGAGTSGQILKSSGSGAPTWANQSTLVAGKATILETTRTIWGRDFNGSANVTGDMSNVGNIAFQASGKNIGGTMYFDTTNHRIGINDSTPSCAFDVTGDVQASGGVAAGGILNLAYNGAGTQGTLTQIQINGRALTDTSGIVNIPLANTTSTGDGAMSHSDKLKLDGIATGATNVNTDTVAGWGYTKNAGTVTGVKMNGSVKGSSGVVDLGTVITDVSGKADKQMNVLVDNNGSATITMTNSTTARYHFVRYPSSSSVTAITLQQATSALTAANCGTAHYELFKNEKSTAITLTLTKYSNSSYYLIAPSKTITIPANSSVELSYIHIAGANSTYYTVVTIGDVMINVS